MFRNGQNEQEQVMDRQERHAVHQSNLQWASGEDTASDREYLRELTKHQLDEHTIALMENMLSQDFVLSNLKDAEVNEIKWLSRNIALKVKRMHPAEESVAQGEARKFYLDDSNDGLRALSPHQENLIDQAVLDFLTRPPRSRDGWQQDEVSKQLRVSKTEDGADEDSRFGGFFS